MKSYMIRATGKIESPDRVLNPYADSFDSGLLCVHDANRLTAADGAQVNAWSDTASPVASPWVGDASISLVANSVAAGTMSKSAVGLKQGNSAISFTSSGYSTNILAAKVGAIHIFMLAKVVFTENKLKNLFSGKPSGYCFANFGSAGTTISLGGNLAGTANVAVIDLPANYSGKWCVMEFVFTPGNAAFHIDGVLVGQGAIAGEVKMDGFTLGANSSAGASSLLTGSIAACRVYNRILSTEERQLLIQQLRRRIA